MKKALSKSETQEKINEFFKKEEFEPEELKKIKRLAMKYKIKLGILKRKFCKKCLNSLRGKIRVSKTHKTVICEKCSYMNKFKIK